MIIDLQRIGNTEVIIVRHFALNAKKNIMHLWVIDNQKRWIMVNEQTGNENKTTENEILEALIIIRKYCAKQRSCKECGIYDETQDRCSLKVRPPSSWKTNDCTIKRWRALK